MFLKKAIEQFLEGYFAVRDRSEKTVKAYQGDLKQFQEALDKNYKLSSITPEMIEAWALSMKQNDYAPASMHRKLISVKIFFNYWVKKKVLSHSPLWNLNLSLGKALDLPKTLTEDEIRKLLSTAKKKLKQHSPSETDRMGPSFLALRNVAIVELLFGTGMRVGEVFTLKLSDFNENERTLLINGKGAKQRIGFITEEQAYRAIINYLRAREQIETENEAFFISVFKKPLSTNGIGNVVKTLSQEAGIQKTITPHMLRHTVATLLLKKGADIRVVQEFLGHASILTTQRYTHISKEHLISTLKKFHPGITLKR